MLDRVKRYIVLALNVVVFYFLRSNLTRTLHSSDQRLLQVPDIFVRICLGFVLFAIPTRRVWNSSPVRKFYSCTTFCNCISPLIQIVILYILLYQWFLSHASLSVVSVTCIFLNGFYYISPVSAIPPTLRISSNPIFSCYTRRNG